MAILYNQQQWLTTRAPWWSGCVVNLALNEIGARIVDPCGYVIDK